MKTFQKVGEDKNFIFTVLAIFFLIILFLNTSFWHSVLIGFFFSTFYFLILGIWLARIISQFFVSDILFHFFLGLFLIFYLIAFGLAVPIVFLKITIAYFYIFLLFLTTVISFINHFLNKKIEISIKQKNSKYLEFKNFNFFTKIFSTLYFIFYLLGWYLIFKARTDKYLLSPWDVLSKYYQLIWFFLAFLLILFIFSKVDHKKILFLIILTSFLFHAYLPFVSKNSFGVDRWRHIGAERRLMMGEIEPPALIGKIDYVKLGPFFLPKVFLMPNKFSYSNQWGMTIALSWLTQIDILKIDQYLIWFLWSIFFTIFVYKLAEIIFNEERLSLLITFVSLFCPFTLQVGGAITIPHAIGFLLFLFFLILFFSYLKNNDKKLWPLIVFSFILLIFNYFLYLILALEIFAFGLIFKRKGLVKKIILPILIIIFIFSLPLLDRVSATSFFVYKPIEAFKKLPEKLLNFSQPISLFYYKFNEKSHLPILIKNIQWQIIFPPIVFFFAVVGFIQYLRKGQKNLIKILTVFLLIFLTNQFISLFFMNGYRLLSTRLANVLMLFLSILFASGLYWLIEKRLKSRISALIVLAIFLALFSLTSYASGPDYGNVTNDELMVARYLDQEMMAKRSCSCKTKQEAIKEFCVFDSSWRLLALEAINGMIAGNFPTHPIDFVQKEKDELYRQMLEDPSREILDKTFQITNTRKCFFVVNSSWLKPKVFGKIKEILGEPVVKNNTYIWYYSK